jgi:hypothetical protein
MEPPRYSYVTGIAPIRYRLEPAEKRGNNEITTPCQSDFSLRTCDLSPSVRNNNAHPSQLWQREFGRQPGVRPHHPEHCGTSSGIYSVFVRHRNLLFFVKMLDGEQSLVQIGPEGSTETFLVTANQFSLTPTCKDYGWISSLSAGGRIISLISVKSDQAMSSLKARC